MQNGEVDRPFALRLPPVIDGCGNGSRLGLLPGTAIERARAHPRDVVPNRAFGHAQEAGDVAVRGAPRYQGLDGHASLPIKPAHPRLRTEPVRELDLNRTRQLVNLAVA
jgi:hypothetical protein